MEKRHSISSSFNVVWHKLNAYHNSLKEWRIKADRRVNVGAQKPVKPTIVTTPDPEQRVHEGLRILARMIVRVYLKEKEEERRLAKGLRPKKFFDKIYINLDRIDTNDAKERQKLHNILDEAIDAATRQNLEPHSAPLILKRDGVRVKIYC